MDCYYRVISDRLSGTEVSLEGQQVIMAASHDYLGLAADPRVQEAAVAAVRRFGTSMSASRAVSGTLSLHQELEEQLAQFLGQEAAVVLPSGYQANLVLAPLLQKGDYVFSDLSNHASLREVIRLGDATERRYLHSDMTRLKNLMASAPEAAGKTILTDGIFSVEGDICELPAIMELANTHRAHVVVDSSHDLGVLGPRGAGASEHYGLRPLLITAALSKSLASVGGTIAGPADVLSYLRFHSHTALFTAAASPPNVAAALAALNILQTEPERRTRLLNLAEQLHNGLRSLGYDTGTSVTPVVPVLVKGGERCLRMWRKLCRAGVFTAPMVYPAVRSGHEVLRITLTAAHTDEQLDRVLTSFETVGLEEGVIEKSTPHIYAPVQIARPVAHSPKRTGSGRVGASRT